MKRQGKEARHIEGAPCGLAEARGDPGRHEGVAEGREGDAGESDPQGRMARNPDPHACHRRRAAASIRLRTVSAARESTTTGIAPRRMRSGANCAMPSKTIRAEAAGPHQGAEGGEAEALHGGDAQSPHEDRRSKRQTQAGEDPQRRQAEGQGRVEGRGVGCAERQGQPAPEGQEQVRADGDHGRDRTQGREADGTQVRQRPQETDVRATRPPSSATAGTTWMPASSSATRPGPAAKG